MSDYIVERLRGKPVRHDYLPEADRQEAADRIERLEADNARLRAERDLWMTRALHTSNATVIAEVKRQEGY